MTVNTVSKLLLGWSFWVLYIALPLFSQTWWVSNVSCLFPYAAALQFGLSLGAYITIGFIFWFRQSKSDQKKDGFYVGILLSVVIGGFGAYQILDKCL